MVHLRQPVQCQAVRVLQIHRRGGEARTVLRRRVHACGACWAQPRCTRIGWANRHVPKGMRYETVTLVDHASGMPVASLGYLKEGGEQWALRAPCEEVPLQAVVV